MITENREAFAAVLARAVDPKDPDARKHILTLLAGCGDVPEAVFADPAALAFKVGATFDRFPNLARLRKALHAEAERFKQADPRPLLTAPPELDGAGLSTEERVNVMIWLKHDQADDLGAHDFTMRLGVLRQSVSAAYDWLIRFNRRAEEIARAQGWLRDPEPEPARVSAPIAHVVDAMEPEVWPTPAREPEKPTQPVEDFTAAFEAKHGRKPGALSAERLAEIRRANPGLQALADSASVPKPPKQPPQPVAAAGGARRRLEPLQWD